ncbi:p21-activated protein kinase-interacting protein 1-like [Drosophila grimshawi]|uniref:GH17949 n=1 Tax=Drosophila grimshawi TaxID=7222 RepID=B4JXG3_DROGR|nr:p21-activated protein kinase-interacting protein 1-like [Drosophila grimshawi]EDV95439.1 GH17949 [Drosophila grimshawi]
MSLPAIEIIVGTYSEYLLGYQLIRQRDDSQAQLKQTFADKSHAGSIKCLAAKGKWIASGGIDDRIFIYDMERRKQAHILTNHTGTINTLVFASDATHLLSGGADGHMIATRVGSWRIEGDWPKAHNRKAVNLLACHPSNRLALSLGADLVLNTWNLIKGRVAYRTNLRSKRELGTAPDCLSWSTTGEHFTLSGPLALAIFEIRSASIVRHIKLPAKAICVAWLDASNCLAGLENGSIAWISLEEGGEEDQEQHPHIIAAHEQRVKAMSCLQDTLVTISSSGELKVWQFPSVADKKLQLLAEANIDCRPTCLALLDLQQCGKQQQEPQHDKQLPESRLDSRQPKEQQPAMATRRGFVSIEFDQQAKDDEENSENSPVSAEEEAESDDAESDDAESDEEESDEVESDEEEDERQAQKQQRVTNRKRQAPLKSALKSNKSKKSKTNK